MKAAQFELSEMDYVRAALWNAEASGMRLHDVIRAAEYAENAVTFDDAVNILADTIPEKEECCEQSSVGSRVARWIAFWIL